MKTVCLFGESEKAVVSCELSFVHYKQTNKQKTSPKRLGINVTKVAFRFSVSPPVVIFTLLSNAHFSSSVGLPDKESISLFTNKK